MDLLLFQLHGPMASWGDIAVGDYRGTNVAPGESAVLGLVAAALGIDRADDDSHARLREGFSVIVATVKSGALLRDYHTVQTPSRSALTRRPHATRRDELAVGKGELNTIISTRDYRVDAWSVVAMQARGGASQTLLDLADALRRPRYVLYLGRKACPPDFPLDPVVLTSPSVLEGVRVYAHRASERRAAINASANTEPTTIERLTWGDAVDVGCAADLTTEHRDQSTRRSRWQFRERTVHQKLRP